jgi:HK97 family phage portal protein
MFDRLLRVFRALTRAVPSGSTGDPWGSLADGYGWGGGQSPNALEGLSAVTSCVQLISTTLAMLPALVMRSDDSGQRVPVDTHPLARLVANGPDATLSWPSYLQAAVADVLRYGNSLSAIETGSNGMLTGLTLYPWPYVGVLRGPTGQLVFEARDPTGFGPPRRLLRSECLLLTDRLDDVGLLGKSVLSRAASSMKLATSVHVWAQQFYGSASRPGGVLTAPGRLSKETAARLKEDWDSGYTNERRWKTAVLPEGLKFESFGIDAETADLIAARRLGVEEVARLFLTPVQLIGDSSRANFNTMEAMLRIFGMFCIAGWAAKIEAEINRALLSPPYSFTLDVSSLTRGDPKTVYEGYASARAAGWMTANEVRAKENLPALPEGNTLTPPAQTTPGSSGSSSDAPPPEEPDDAPPPKQYRNGHDRHA